MNHEVNRLLFGGLHALQAFTFGLDMDKFVGEDNHFFELLSPPDVQLVAFTDVIEAFPRTAPLQRITIEIGWFLLGGSDGLPPMASLLPHIDFSAFDRAVTAVMPPSDPNDPDDPPAPRFPQLRVVRIKIEGIEDEELEECTQMLVEALPRVQLAGMLEVHKSP